MTNEFYDCLCDSPPEMMDFISVDRDCPVHGVKPEAIAVERYNNRYEKEEV